jgi:GTP:adenosylcobinamide-phosphate guanylyltransferase
VSTIEINFDAKEMIQRGYEEDMEWAKKHKGAPVLMMSND